MIKVLLLAYSSFARRRVLPAFATCGIQSIDIASESAVAVEWPTGCSGRVFRNYECALRDTDAELVYVSTVNSSHARLARLALNYDRHVVIDKPATLRFGETCELVKLAEQRRLCLVEAVTYGYHPLMSRLTELFRENDSAPQHLVTTFSFPPMHAGNFRYRTDLGGGALWDLAPYAVSVGRMLFGGGPDEIVCRCIADKSGVDVSFYFIAQYPHERHCVGTFGFTTGYMNRLEVLGPGVVVTVNRVYAPPPDSEMEIEARIMDRPNRIVIEPADAVVLFFRDVFDAIAQNKFSIFADRMLSDSDAIQRLRQSALGRAE